MHSTGYTTGVWKPPNKNSIDAAQDAALDEVRSYFPRAPLHRDCREGANNLLDGWAVYGRVGQFFGHGAPGMISTGCGKQIMNAAPGELISTHRYDWEHSMERLKGRVKALRLSGCSVGAGYDGLRLLREISCLIDAPVLAPTGTLFVSGGRIWIQPGATWQIGECGFEGTPLNMSRRSRRDRDSNSSPGLSGWLTDADLDVHFERPQYAGGGSADWSGDRAREVLALAGFLDEPVTSARALGIPTGTLTVRSEAEERSYELLGESALEFDSGVATYAVSQEFLDLLPPYRPTL